MLLFKALKSLDKKRFVVDMSVESDEEMFRRLVEDIK